MAYYKFTNEYGETYGSCEVFKWDRFDCEDAGLIERAPDSATGWACYEFGIGGPLKVDTDPTEWEGWFWWACFPGCLADGDPMGPFDSEESAMADANCV